MYPWYPVGRVESDWYICKVNKLPPKVQKYYQGFRSLAYLVG